MTRRASCALMVAVLAIGCSNAKRDTALTDSLTAVAAADSARLAAVAADVARRDSIAKAAAVRTKTIGSKATTDSGVKAVGMAAKTGGASTGRGYDSVRLDPIKRVPVPPDTAKKRPPR